MLVPLNAPVNCEVEVDSLPTVAVGVLRHRRLSSFTERGYLTQTVAPMRLGSVVGAGGLFVGVVPATALKFVPGVILIVSAVRIFRGSWS
jgi:uncharacterized protein